MLAELLNGEIKTGMNLESYNEIGITGITCDSRAVHRGYLFAAIPGTQNDGRRFIADALDRGAVAILAPPGTSLEPHNNNVPLLIDENPRRQYALMAARFFSKQPDTIACVTGTNGKTSVVSFLRQIWAAAGYQAASLGTLGVELAGQPKTAEPKPRNVKNLTTPDPTELHRSLAEMTDLGFSHLGLEASSHGLAQYRLNGVRVAAAAFTNLTRDHLDYHGDAEKYLSAKLRLFSDVLRDNGTMVVNADIPEASVLRTIAAERSLNIIDYGFSAADLVILNCEPDGTGQDIELELFGVGHQVRLPLPGAFQAVNALAAVGLAVSTSVPVECAVTALAELKGVCGRMELAAKHPNGASIYVDYAHTPGALMSMLAALRPHVTGALHLVFGCGGNRDPGKRIEMGRIAELAADYVIITDDNPRTEDPAAIRQTVLAGCPSAIEIGDRAEAIAEAVLALKPGDILVIAGKGHESAQYIGNQAISFDDAKIARQAIQELTL